MADIVEDWEAGRSPSPDGSGSGCQPSASASLRESSQSGIPNAVDWEEGLRLFFDRTNALEFLSRGVQSGGFPVADHGQLSWSEWLAMGVRMHAPPLDPNPYAVLEWIGGHDASANGLSGFAADLVDSFCSEARRAVAAATVDKSA